MEAEELQELRRTLDDLAAASEPQARLLVPAAAGPWKRIVVLPGAFHPPTLAHVALARAALERGFDAALFALGTTTIDKPIDGLSLEERASLLADTAAVEPGLGLVLQSHGLYGEQATALRRAFPGVDDLAFVVGMDKVPQIFDSRYYVDRSAGLEALFSLARLLVAPRGGRGRVELDEILERPEARPFRSRIEWLPLDPRWSDVSATSVRNAVRRGEAAADLLPPVVAARLRIR